MKRNSSFPWSYDEIKKLVLWEGLKTYVPSVAYLYRKRYEDVIRGKPPRTQVAYEGRTQYAPVVKELAEDDLLAAIVPYLDSKEQVFVLGPLMQEAFSRTNLEELRVRDVLLPFASFCVVLPENPFQCFAGGGQVAPLAGFMMYTKTFVFRSGEAPVVYLQIMPYHQISKTSGASGKLGLGGIIGVNLTARADERIEDVIQEQLRRGAEKDPTMEEDLPNNENMLASVVSWGLNLCLYLGCRNCKRQQLQQLSKKRHSVRKRRKSKKKVELRPSSNVTLIGPNFDDLYKEAEGERTGGGKQRAQVVHMVASHYHHYWEGPKNDPDNRKSVRKWVLAYPKGSRPRDVEGPHVTGMCERSAPV